MDVLPSSITSAGKSVNFVFRTNSTTYFVSPGVCGNGAGTQAGFSLAPSVAGDKPTVVTTAPKLAEDRRKSRLFIAANTHFIGSDRVIVDPALPVESRASRPAGRARRPSLHRVTHYPITVLVDRYLAHRGSYFFPTAITTNEFGKA